MAPCPSHTHSCICRCNDPVGERNPGPMPNSVDSKERQAFSVSLRLKGPAATGISKKESACCLHMPPSTGVQTTSFPGNAFLKVGLSLLGVSVGPLGSLHWRSSNYNEVSFKWSISVLKPTESTTATGASDFKAFLKNPRGHVCLPSRLFILERVTCAPWFSQNPGPKKGTFTECDWFNWLKGWMGCRNSCKNPHVQSQTKTQLNAEAPLLKWRKKTCGTSFFPHLLPSFWNLFPCWPSALERSLHLCDPT